MPPASPIAETDWKTIDGMFIKQIWCPREGTLVSMHAHKYGHSTLVARGAILVWQEGLPEQLVRAPQVLFIPADRHHQYQTLEPGCLIYCLHNLHGEDAVKVLAEEGLEISDVE